MQAAISQSHIIFKVSLMTYFYILNIPVDIDTWHAVVVLRNFAKFTVKHLCQRFFFNKVVWDLRPFLIKLPEACNFTKKEALAQVFSCEFCGISKNTFFTEHLRRTASALLNSLQYFTWLNVETLLCIVFYYFFCYW